MARDGGLGAHAAHARGARFRSRRSRVIHDVAARRRGTGHRSRRARAQERAGCRCAEGDGRAGVVPGRRLHQRHAPEAEIGRAHV